jgi:tellurite resistance protein
MEMWQEIVGKFVRPTTHPSFQTDDLASIEDELYEDTLASHAEEAVSGIAVVIDYTNAKGESATRLISCRKVDVRGDLTYVSAFCHSRAAPRQFRIDRIREVFDHKTGEGLGDAATFFGRFKPDSIESSPLGFGLSVKRRADLMALLNAVVFVARCDKEYHPLERSVLENLVARFWLRLEISSELDDSAVLRLADRLAPDAETFWVSLHRLANDDRLAKLMLEGAGDVIAADGTITNEEFYWGTKLEEFFLDNARN